MISVDNFAKAHCTAGDNINYALQSVGEGRGYPRSGRYISAETIELACQNVVMSVNVFDLVHGVHANHSNEALLAWAVKYM